MPFTHVEIEERKTRTITFLALLLVVLYTGSILVLFSGTRFLTAFPSSDPLELLVVIGVAVCLTMAHWYSATARLFERVVVALGAQPADGRDTYHARFANIVQEVSVAMGGRPIEAYVIATPALNACAWADRQGRAAIAVTEGTLAVLNRAQLESVVGHEAAHIVSGDSLMTSVVCGLFALHEEALKRLCGFFDADRGARTVRGRGALVILFAIIVLWLTTLLKKIFEMMISRHKEYRADAVAVRLTRNPLGLAEALHIIAHRWRGVGTQGESLSSLFILDPGTEPLSEQEGWLADVFSTHPPTERRIQSLLGMAHMGLGPFEDTMAVSARQREARPLPCPTPLEESTARWLVWHEAQWLGPLSLAELTTMEGIKPETWVRSLDEPGAKPAHQDSRLLTMFRTRYAGSGENRSSQECPRCRVGLGSILYEGAPVDECPACHGCYVDSATMTKLFARHEYDVPESIKRRGELLLSKTGYAMARSAFRAMPHAPVRWSCPRCSASVVRKFYTEAYPVEVEQCWACGLAWLDQHERELLQYLYEQREARLGTSTSR